MPSRNDPLPVWTKQSARELRRSATDAEVRLWYHLRSGRLGGLKFRRQHPLPPYIVDFYCEAAKLAVELDGSQHGGERDAQRTLDLEYVGIMVLRFWNDQALKETEAVLQEIYRVASERVAPSSC
jgi:very-short-patch-repair endonuclease